MNFRPRGLLAAGAAWLCVATAGPALATSDFGVRYWYSFGETSKELYDIAGTALLSRLTYSDLKTPAGELYGASARPGSTSKASSASATPTAAA
jgi:hypothetical protein